MRLAVLVALAACGGDDGPTGELTARVTHYDYTFDLASRAAHATVTAIADTPGDCVRLPLRATLDPASAKLDGKPATGNATGTVLVLCGKGHAAGTTLTIDLDLTVALATLATSQVGYSLTPDGEGHTFSYLVSWLGGCDRFAPCDTRPDTFATYTFHVTHPADQTVRCPGTITEVSPTETTCDFPYDGGPTYSTFGIAAFDTAAWTPVSKGMWGSAKVTVYDRPSTQITGAIDAAYHAGFVAWLEATFGPYPFGDELRILTAPTYWDGFEHPGNIVLDDGLARQTRPVYAHPVAHTLDHEIAHQWAGDQTTLADTYDFVWKESMAEYLAYVYEDMTEPAAAVRTAGYWTAAAGAAQFYPVPDDHPSLFEYYGDVYAPGPLILFRQLEVLSSRAQVIEALKTVLGQPRALSLDELVATLATSTGLDLTAYAAGWLHGTGKPEWPIIDLSFANGVLNVHQRNAFERRCKFHVALQGAAGESALVEVDTFHNGPLQSLTVPSPGFDVTTLLLDPKHECLVETGTTTRVAPRGWRSERGLAADRR